MIFFVDRIVNVMVMKTTKSVELMDKHTEMNVKLNAEMLDGLMMELVSTKVMIVLIVQINGLIQFVVLMELDFKMLVLPDVYMLL